MKAIRAILVMICVSLFAVGAAAAGSFGGNGGGGNFIQVKTTCGPWNQWCGSLNAQHCGPWNGWCSGNWCGPWNGWCGKGGGGSKCGPWNNWCKGQANTGGPNQKCGKWNNWCKGGGGTTTGNKGGGGTTTGNKGGGGTTTGGKGQVDQASCAKAGLTYIGGAGNTCYCPGSFVNKGTGLPAASSASQCVSVASYNQLEKLPGK